MNVKKGDVDLDGYLTPADMVYIQNYLARYVNFNAANWYAADLNCDYRITVHDVNLLQYYYYEILYPGEDIE